MQYELMKTTKKLMKTIKMKLRLFFLIIGLSLPMFGQIDLEKVNTEFDRIAQQRKGINETLRIDVEGLTLSELITTIGEEHELNFNVTDELDEVVNSNFYDVVVRDVLLFLLQRYKLDIEFINGIMVFSKPKAIEKKEIPLPPKEIDVSYNEKNEFLSVKLKNDSLPQVAQAITDASKKNIVLAPDIKDAKVSSYILNRPFEQVLDMMAKSNGLVLIKDENDFYYLAKDNAPKEEKANPNSRRSRRGGTAQASQTPISGTLNLALDEAGFIDIKAIDVPVTAVIEQVSDKLNIHYSMYDKPEEDVKMTLVATGITFDDVLTNMFRGKEYTFSKEDDFYLIGKHDTEGLLQTKLIQLENRSIEAVLESVPQSITESLEIKEFIELNGFVVTGSKTQLEIFKTYIHEIDVVVPVVKIEVLIVQYQKGYDINTGLQLGIDNQERTTSGTFLPGADVTLNSGSVNNLIDAFNGFGIVRLGKVTREFYANLRAMENNSMVKIASTPKLVTLNGHEATSTIGETSYYFEQTNQLANVNGGGVGQNLLQSGTFQSTDANLSVNITPQVSKDEHVTLSIEVERSSFLGRISPNAPPDRATQRFQSSIRVKNNEMILLGGLEELEKENSGSGTPVLSRIPVIKWFFSNRTKRKDKSKLHLFIKPTIIY